MRFELTRAKPNGLAVHPLNHSGTVSKKKAVVAGFEPAQAMPNRFQVCLLNHSDIPPQTYYHNIIIYYLFKS